MQRDLRLLAFLGTCLTAGAIAGAAWWTNEREMPVAAVAVPQQRLVLMGADELVVAGDSWSGYFGARDGEVKDRFQKRGRELIYRNIPDQRDRAQKLCSGKIDLLMTISAQYFEQNSHKCGTIVKIIDDSDGGDAIFLNNKQFPQLKSLADLKSIATALAAREKKAKIVLAKDGPSSYLLDLLSAKFNLDVTDFDRIEVADASEAWQILQSDKEAILAVLWEPFGTQAKRAGYLEILSSRDVPGAIKDVFVASNRLIEGRPQVLTDFLEVYARVMDENLSDSSRLISQLAADGNLSKEDAKVTIEGIDFYSSARSLEALKNKDLEKHLQSTAATLALTGKIGNIPQNFASFYNFNYLAQARANLQKQFALVAQSDSKLAKGLQGTNRPTLSTNKPTRRRAIGSLKQRGKIEFAFGKAALTPQSREYLRNLAKDIAQLNPQTIEIEIIGHTSATGNQVFNDYLSQKRANTVANELKKMGLKHEIVATGKGSRSPISNLSPTDPAQQRTDILAIGLR